MLGLRCCRQCAERRRGVCGHTLHHAPSAPEFAKPDNLFRIVLPSIFRTGESNLPAVLRKANEFMSKSRPSCSYLSGPIWFLHSPVWRLMARPKPDGKGMVIRLSVLIFFGGESDQNQRADSKQRKLRQFGMVEDRQHETYVF